MPPCASWASPCTATPTIETTGTKCSILPRVCSSSSLHCRNSNPLRPSLTQQASTAKRTTALTVTVAAAPTRRALPSTSSLCRIAISTRAAANVAPAVAADGEEELSTIPRGNTEGAVLLLNDVEVSQGPNTLFELETLKLLPKQRQVLLHETRDTT